MLNARGHPLVNFNMFHKDYTISWPSRTIFRRGLEFLSYTCGDVFESRSSCFSQLLTCALFKALCLGRILKLAFLCAMHSVVSFRFIQCGPKASGELEEEDIAW
jgi:hypothetical protein